MGNLGAHLLLDASFEDAVLFPAILDAGCSVRDVVQLAQSCQAARLFVSACVSALTRPRLTQLCLSLQPDESNRFFNANHQAQCQQLKLGDLVWEICADSIGKLVRLLRLEALPSRTHYVNPVIWRWGPYTDTVTVLFAVLSDETPADTNVVLTWPKMGNGGSIQWYPLLDAPLRTCLARLDYEAASVERHMAAYQEDMQRARKRLRVADSLQ